MRKPSETPEVAAVLDSAEFAEQLAELAHALDRTPEDVREEVVKHLREMSASHNPTFLEPWHRLGGWMLRGYDLLLDEEGLGDLRALDLQHSLVFLVSHRSYLDEWAFPPAIVDQGIRAPFGFAGANLNFFPLGNIARRTGMVHIRRSTNGVPVYKLALRAFMRQLVASNANLIWSIEGGRTRTGKLRPPRYGLLRYVVDAVDELESSNVLLVPVSILYDRLPSHEVELMTAEARGHGKTPEDVKWFLGYLRGLRQRLGRVYVDFGEPIPLRERLAELRAESSSESTAVERIAVQVSHHINMATPVTPTAVVCIALLAADRALTLDEVLTTVEPLAAYLRSRKWPTAGAANLTDRATVRRALQDLVRSRVLTSFQGETTVWGIRPDQHLVAAVYRNSAIHVLVERSILELALLQAAEAPAGQPVSALDDALRLRDLLKFEFFFPARDQFASDLREELALIDPQTLHETSAFASNPKEHLAQIDAFTAPLALRPFIDAYNVVAYQLKELGDSRTFDEKHFIARCLIVGHQWALQRKIASEESASAEMFQTALRLARHLGLVESTAPDLARRREEFEQEISGIRDRIARLAAREAAVREPRQGRIGVQGGNQEMTSTTRTLTGSKGDLVVRTWKAQEGKYAALLAHGIGEHTGRYDHVAEHLLTHGAAAVYGPDHYGHGLSSGDRAEIDDLDLMVADLHLVAQQLRQDHPGLPVVLVGHSLGGIIATRYAQLHGDELAALVLSAPVIGGNPAFEGLLAMDPMPEVPIDPAALSRDPAIGEAYLADPLIYHGPLSRQTLSSIFATVDVIGQGPDLGPLPTLWIHGELDPLAPYDVTANAFKKVGGSELQQKLYPGAMHEIFNETNKAEVLDDVTTFLTERLG